MDSKHQIKNYVQMKKTNRFKRKLPKQLKASDVPKLRLLLLKKQIPGSRVNDNLAPRFPDKTQVSTIGG